MKRTLPWQTPARNYYPLPKVLCQLGLSPGEIAVYSFLMYCENRTTYQCYPSYRLSLIHILSGGAQYDLFHQRNTEHQSHLRLLDCR